MGGFMSVMSKMIVINVEMNGPTVRPLDIKGSRGDRSQNNPPRLGGNCSTCVHGSQVIIELLGTYTMEINRHVSVRRLYFAPFFDSLEIPGFSISVLRLTLLDIAGYFCARWSGQHQFLHFPR